MMLQKYLLVCFVVLNLFNEISLKSYKEEIIQSLTKEEPDDFELLLQEIMIKSLHSYKCISIICDPIYSTVFHKSWFKRFRRFISYIMINVEEYDDLLAPNNETQSSLVLAKNNGCQMYIILIANGLQVARLLKFGDRYRVLNTRSKYILFFDNRLFEKKILYLWKRIINVVFIKKHSGKILKDGRSQKVWYELTTVPFPTHFEELLIPRRLDIWTMSKFRKGTDLFRDKTSDLKNQTLKVASFSHVPGTVKKNTTLNKDRITMVSDSKEVFSGTEIEGHPLVGFGVMFVLSSAKRWLTILCMLLILNTVAYSMNFHCEIYEPDNADVELWGRKQVGGIYSGLLGEMATSKPDLALGDLYYIPFILDIMDLSIPYNTECLTFLTPEALTDISWKTLILPFSPIMWTCVIVCLVISSLAFYTLAKFHTHFENLKKEKKNYKNRAVEIKANKKRQFANLSIYSQILKMDSNLKYSMLKEQYKHPKEEDDPEGLYQFSEPINSVLYTYSMLLLVSLPKLPTGWSLRMLTGWYWLYCLLVVVAYRASMTAILARPTPRVTIDSLQELIDSKLTYGGWGEINTQFFKSSPDQSIKIIESNFEIVNSSEEAVDRVADGTFAFYENTYFLKEAILKRQNRFQETIIGNSTDKTRDIKNSILKSDRSLHIMRDCIINMPISIGLQKNSPIKPRVDILIRKVIEAGLVKKWLNDVMQKILINNTEQDDDGPKALMNLKKLYGALVALGVGYILGLITLALENGHFHYFVVKNPGFNKYSKTIVTHIKKSE